MLVEGNRVRIVKGCKARGIDKGITARIDNIQPLGADYSYAVRVVVRPLNGFKAGRQFVFFVRHMNRLADPIVRMNDGNPSNTIEVQRIIPISSRIEEHAAADRVHLRNSRRYGRDR